MTTAKPGTPLKFVTHSDNCPHEIDCPATKRVRLFVNAIKYKGKCYSACDCGKIVLEMDNYQANHLVKTGCAECVNEMVPLSEPGHECCEKHANDPVPDPEVMPVLEPVAKPPSGPAVVTPEPVAKAPEIQK